MQVERYDGTQKDYLPVSDAGELAPFTETSLLAQILERINRLPKDGSRFLVFSVKEELTIMKFLGQVVGGPHLERSFRQQKRSEEILLDILLRPVGWNTTLVPTNGDGMTPPSDVAAWSLALAPLRC